jgi:hypothetical protein
MAGFASQGILNKNHTVWQDGAGPPQRYICKYMKIKMAELHVNDVCFGDKTIEQSNCFVWGIIIFLQIVSIIL